MKAETEKRMRELLAHAIHKTHPLSPSLCSICEAIDKELELYFSGPKQP